MKLDLDEVDGGQVPPEGADRRRRSVVVKVLLAVGGLGFIGLVAGAGYARSLWVKAISDHCEVLPEPELTLDEMVALKWRHEAWQRDNNPEARLQLDVRELSFLLQGRFPFDVAIDEAEGLARIRLAVPAGGGQCWNVDYRGHIEVVDGVATLQPERVLVGEADLTFFLGRQMRFSADDLKDPKAAEMLANAQHIEMQGGLVRVALIDRWKR